MNSTIANRQRKRDANLDLLRILSMLLIIFLHTIDHTGVMEAAETASNAMYFYVRFTYAATQVCVNCYVMLSGYYLVKSTFSIRKLAKLWMEAVFYTLVFKFIFICMGRENLSVVTLVSCFFPILTGRYWFLTIYAGLYLVSPFLNLFISTMGKKVYTSLNICLFVLFSLWNSFHPAIAGMNSGGGWGLAWFVVLYLCAAWFRLYYTPDEKPIGKLLIFLLIPALVAMAQLVARMTGIGILQTVATHWFRYESAPVYLMTLSLFVCFLNIHISNKKAGRMICTIAPLTFGVYLIHTHPDVSPWLWEVTALPRFMDSMWFPVIQIGCVLMVFAVCAVMDELRKRTVGKLENHRVVELLCEKITDACHRGAEKL